MAKRGRKPLSRKLHLIRGTDQPCRRATPVVPPLDGPAVRPTWLSPEAVDIWDRKTSIYELRGQQVRGCEDALAQYCAVEAKLIASWKKHRQPSVKLITAHRIYANEFYDTPASQAGTTKRATKANPFAALGPGPGPAAARA